MSLPYQVDKHNYHENKKRNDIETPDFLCKWIYDTIMRELPSSFNIFNILDPCAGNGNLTKPFKDHYGDIKKLTYEEYEIKKGTDFFNVNKLKYQPDLVLCNPPFNGGENHTSLPEKFLKKIIELVGYETQIVFFCPMWFIANLQMQRGNGKTSDRYIWLENEAPPITSVVFLPKNTFIGYDGNPEWLRVIVYISYWVIIGSYLVKTYNFTGKKQIV